MIKKLIPILLLLSLTPNAFAATFTDVSQKDFSYDSIEFFAQKKVIEGYKKSDGTKQFKPTQSVNRAEAVKMVLSGSAKAFDIPTTIAANSPFKDVPQSIWYAPYATYAFSSGIVSGDSKTKEFQGQRSVTKAELIKMLIKANDIDLTSSVKDIGANVSRDVSTKDWYYDYMRYAKEYGLISPDSNGNLNPTKSLTRSEVAYIMYNTLKNVLGGEVQQLLSRTETHIFLSLKLLDQNSFDEAVQEANQSVILVTKAKNLAPDDLTTSEAAIITESFTHIITAYKAKKQGNNTTTSNIELQTAKDMLKNIKLLLGLKTKLNTIMNSLK